MLLSMTGFGEAQGRDENLAVTVELRSVNNKHFKLTTRLGEGYSVLEPQIDNLLRPRIRRGAVQVFLRVEHVHSPDDYKLNTTVLESYRRQWEEFRGPNARSVTSVPELMLTLPGVVEENSAGLRDVEGEWPLIERTLAEAADKLTRMREEEGRAMAADLTANCRTIAQELAKIERRAPLVTDSYRQRLRERVEKMLAELGATLQPADLIREVGIFAERSDISEEVVRLRSHLDQFAATVELPESSGRKLEFIIQEMFREANTIGSKANDVEISHQVIEIKTAIERLREMIQNVE